MQNLIQEEEEIKRRLNSDNACYHSVQNHLYSRLLSRKAKIRIYHIIIFLVVLNVCETWSLTLRDKHRLRVGFQVFTAVTMKNAVFWDVVSCGFIIN
jgi:hypothetical protein